MTLGTASYCEWSLIFLVLFYWWQRPKTSLSWFSLILQSCPFKPVYWPKMFPLMFNNKQGGLEFFIILVCECGKVWSRSTTEHDWGSVTERVSIPGRTSPSNSPLRARSHKSIRSQVCSARMLRPLQDVKTKYTFADTSWTLTAFVEAMWRPGGSSLHWRGLWDTVS